MTRPPRAPREPRKRPDRHARRTLCALVVVLSGLAAPGQAAAWQQEARQPPASSPLPRFSHGDHPRVSCTSCHNSRERHGALVVRTVADCRNCHHVGDERADCRACHENVRIQPTIAVSFSPAGRRTPVTRQIRFPHAAHADEACSRCHESSSTQAATRADCTGCHSQHHETESANCLACHRAAGALATHKLADHTTCAAAACHGARGANLPDTRSACLVCHQRQASHKPMRNCSTCHQVRVT